MPEPVTLTNAVLPVTALAVLVIWLPSLLTPKNNLSRWALAGAIFITAAVAYLAGAAMMAGLYTVVNEGIWQAFVGDPLGRAWFFLGRSTLFAMLWVPLLALVWLIKAQGLEQRRGLRMLDEEEGR